MTKSICLPAKQWCAENNWHIDVGPWIPWSPKINDGWDLGLFVRIFEVCLVFFCNGAFDVFFFIVFVYYYYCYYYYFYFYVCFYLFLFIIIIIKYYYYYYYYYNNNICVYVFVVFECKWYKSNRWKQPWTNFNIIMTYSSSSTGKTRTVICSGLWFNIASKVCRFVRHSKRCCDSVLDLTRFLFFLINHLNNQIGVSIGKSVCSPRWKWYEMMGMDGMDDAHTIDGGV